MAPPPGLLVEDWRIEYNTVRPHNALGNLTPTDYAKAWATIHPELSYGWTNNWGRSASLREEGIRMSASTGHDNT